MAKKEWDIKSVERLAKKNREKSMRESKELEQAEKEGKNLPEGRRTSVQNDHEEARTQKLFNEMKERDF